jgi:hypothetical protein
MEHYSNIPLSKLAGSLTNLTGLERPITLDELEGLTLIGWEEKNALEVLLDFNAKGDEDVVDGAISLMNQAKDIIVERLEEKQVPHLYVNRQNLLTRLLEFPPRVEDFFPVPIYISSSPGEYDTIGLLIHYDGHLEYFEGNEDASDSTYQLVSGLLGEHGQQTTIYGAHSRQLVDKIREEGAIPKGVFVTPYRPHAEAYLDYQGDRVLFSADIDKSCVKQHHDLDWQVYQDCPIMNLRTF